MAGAGPSRAGAAARAREHDRDLAEGRVGEHPLEVGLREREQGGIHHRHGGEDGEQGAGAVVAGVEGEEARDDVAAGGDHRRRVDECRGRRRALHRVGEPVVERDEARLAGDADDDADEADRSAAVSCPLAVSTPMRSVLRARTASATRPTTMPMSATRVTMKALYAARLAAGRSLSWPMSSHEHQPMISQPTSMSTRSEDCTSQEHAAGEERHGGRELAVASVVAQVPRREDLDARAPRA